MPNKNKAKGTRYETKMKRSLETLLDTYKTQPGSKMHDLQAGDVPVECKKRAYWEMNKYLKDMRDTHGRRRWFLFCSPADERKSDSLPSVVTMPTPLFFELLEMAYGSKEVDPRPVVVETDPLGLGGRPDFGEPWD